ncbi:MULTISPECIES: NAD(P)-dependent oxidoreductase [Paraburkholderia]|uniref:3-hydroxyisobutyrate dehydrogenase n=2 Tax=Paraburkholderia TaxID=1822464 RepID=A0A7W8L338_9BURK|nr:MULTISPECIES: NAD-binding protein [Paraburkholderia]MBB5399439.1 3-hydroxyisobutyrate dehydrogenase [Paraburkholderia youngii]MBB5422585.1 3-hydroxyisobutyrate dehydrogenase [Paraburkholderia atlantica]
MTTIGLAGSGDIAAFVVRQLASKYKVRVLDVDGGPLRCESAEKADSATALIKGVEIVVLCTDSDAARDSLLRRSDWINSASAVSPILVDMSQGDPDETSLFAKDFSERGITYVDAPLHTENTEAIEEGSAIFFGGPATVLDSVRDVLTAVCPKVIHCGEVGTGHAMRLIVAAIAACNRLITYECAAMGARNGLAMGDMATVLNKSSGYNSASARVLPALAANKRTADVTLGACANDLRKASAVGMRYGAPMLIATMARSTLDAASNRLGESRTIDALAEIWEADSGLPAPGAA